MARRDSVVVRIESMLSAISSPVSYNPKIYKVYDKMRQLNEMAYDPVLVAIGPIHHNKDHLKPMEQIKASYLHHFLQVKNERVDKYVQKLRQLEERARNSYSNFIQLPEGDKFVEMLLLDGFFVIQLLRKLHIKFWMVENEHILQFGHILKRVLVDLLLVENQIPFFVLSELFDMSKIEIPDDNLSLLIRKRLCLVLPWKKVVDSHIGDKPVDDHLLGMVYRAHFPENASKRRNCMDHPDYKTINTASQLEETGIKFKVVEEATLMDVKFTDGVMQLPCLTLDDDIEVILRNLIAYEHMFVNNHRPVTDYSEFMMYLVNSSKDVEILRHAGIFKYSGGEEELHIMFVKLGKQVLFYEDKFSYLEVYDSVNKHCQRRRHRWMANLRRNYFNTPWAIMSVIAATILLGLTVVQTVYAILERR